MQHKKNLPTVNVIGSQLPIHNKDQVHNILASIYSPRLVQFPLVTACPNKVRLSTVNWRSFGHWSLLLARVQQWTTLRRHRASHWRGERATSGLGDETCYSRSIRAQLRIKTAAPLWTGRVYLIIYRVWRNLACWELRTVDLKSAGQTECTSEALHSAHMHRLLDS